MKSIRFLLTFGVLIFSIFALNGSSTPNIILCMADDQGWEETGYYGHPILHTPTMDKMARSGLRLDRFYSAAPNCGPTRGSIMTGRHPNRFGKRGIRHPRDKAWLSFRYGGSSTTAPAHSVRYSIGDAADRRSDYCGESAPVGTC